MQREQGSSISSLRPASPEPAELREGQAAGEERKRRGATYPRQSPRARRPGRERRLCLRSRRRRARPGGSQPRRAASSRGRPDSPARGSGSGSRLRLRLRLRSGPRPHRPAIAAAAAAAPPRAGPRPRAAGPPPAAAAGAGEPGLGVRGRPPTPRAPLLPASPATPRSARGADGPCPPKPPAEATSPGGLGARAFSESSLRPEAAWPSCPGARSQESSVTLEAGPHFCRGGGDPSGSAREGGSRGGGEAGSSPAPAESGPPKPGQPRAAAAAGSRGAGVEGADGDLVAGLEPCGPWPSPGRGRPGWAGEGTGPESRGLRVHVQRSRACLRFRVGRLGCEPVLICRAGIKVTEGNQTLEAREKESRSLQTCARQW